MKWLILFLILIPFSFAEEGDFIITYNQSDLPLDGITHFNFTLIPNESIFFEELINDSFISLDYPKNITLVNESQVQFDVNYSIPYFAVTDESNSTMFNNTIGVTNSVNSNIVFLTLVFNISHPHEELIEESYLRMIDDGKKVEIRTFTIAGFNQTHPVEFYAPYNTTILVRCDQFMRCPISVTAGIDNRSRFDVEIIVPVGTPSGTYHSFVELAKGNKSGRINFTIRVEDKEDIYKIISYDVFDSSCYDDVESLAECYKEQSKYNAEVANALLDQLEKKACADPIIINETITEYITVGTLDDELLNEKNILSQEFSDLTKNFNTLNSNYRTCQDELTKVKSEKQTEIQAMGTEFLLKENNIREEAILTQEELTITTHQKLQSTFGWLLVAFIVFTILGLYLENNWVIRHFPKKVFISLILLFFIGWVALKFIGG